MLENNALFFAKLKTSILQLKVKKLIEYNKDKQGKVIDRPVIDCSSLTKINSLEPQKEDI
jgi:hypothetical protein